jgi:hypothetical protein
LALPWGRYGVVKKARAEKIKTIGSPLAHDLIVALSPKYAVPATTIRDPDAYRKAALSWTDFHENPADVPTSRVS